MATDFPFDPAEIYLLEYFTSLEYYEPMVHTWQTMVDNLETSLDRFMNKLPSSYRARHQSEQPDIAWGQRCIPNFRSTLQYLQDGLVEVKAGDVGGLKSATWVNTDFQAQREYSSAWLEEVESGAEDRYRTLLSLAVDRSSNIARTVGSYWIYKSLRRRWLDERNVLPALPDYWPEYQFDLKVTVATDAAVKVTGLYVPAQAESSPNLLIAGQAATDTGVGLNEYGGQYQRLEPTVWTLVRRVSDRGSMIACLPGSTAEQLAESESVGRNRVESGQPCTRSGWWTSPAKANSRRYFEQGAVMPSLSSEYGLTIWQWDIDQSNPKL